MRIERCTIHVADLVNTHKQSANFLNNAVTSELHGCRSGRCKTARIVNQLHGNAWRTYHWKVLWEILHWARGFRCSGQQFQRVPSCFYFFSLALTITFNCSGTRSQGPGICKQTAVGRGVLNERIIKSWISNHVLVNNYLALEYLLMLSSEGLYLRCRLSTYSGTSSLRRWAKSTVSIMRLFQCSVLACIMLLVLYHCPHVATVPMAEVMAVMMCFLQGYLG